MPEIQTASKAFPPNDDFLWNFLLAKVTEQTEGK
jgi:hypothetical protein